jgi:abequosyltransferase
MMPFFYNSWSNINVKSQFNFCDQTQFIKYLEQSNSLGAIYSYLSSIIFKKTIWDNIVYDNEFTGTAYSHAYKLLKFRSISSNLVYIPDHLVMCRHGNDHFMKDGIVKRFMLDIDGYLLLANKLFNKEPMIYYAFLNVMTREHKFSKLIFIKSKSSNNEWLNIINKLEIFGYNKLMLMSLIFFPNRILTIIYKVIYRLERILTI